MTFERITLFLENAPLGIFGAAHLGRAIAEGLLAVGFPRE